VTLALSLVEKGCRPKEVCDALGLPRATFYRHRSPPHEPTHKPPRHPPANRLSDQESAKILETMHEEEYIDLCPREIVPKLADKGVYLGSIRTFYRVLSRNEEVRERRLQARRPAIVAPVLEATGPNQVWTWDISRLAGPYQGKWYFLYMMLDLFSRYTVGWMVAERENARLAQRFIRETVRKHIPTGQELTIHSDRGAPMTACTTQELMMLLGVRCSYSRPRTSDDNPYSESAFRTTKYHWTMPSFFPTKEAAIGHMDQFMTWYNEDHMHSGLNLLTPAMVHHGKVGQVVRARQTVMTAAYQAHPERFAQGMPKVRTNPQSVGINTRMKAIKVAAEPSEADNSACDETEPSVP
jgi:putative transposase